MTDSMPYIYADNAATTPLSPRALEAMTPYLTRSFGNPSGIHRMAREAAVALGEARGTMARLLAPSMPTRFTSPAAARNPTTGSCAEPCAASATHMANVPSPTS